MGLEVVLNLVKAVYWLAASLLALVSIFEASIRIRNHLNKETTC